MCLWGGGGGGGRRLREGGGGGGWGRGSVVQYAAWSLAAPREVQ